MYHKYIVFHIKTSQNPDCFETNRIKKKTQSNKGKIQITIHKPGNIY